MMLASSRARLFLASCRSATMLNVKASMNANRPRIAPAIAETGASFSFLLRKHPQHPHPVEQHAAECPPHHRAGGTGSAHRGLEHDAGGEKRLGQRAELLGNC